MSSDPRIGSEIAGYRVRSLLGRGGMSVVYLAEDARLERLVALKVLATELGSDERFRERFVRESRLAASLDHPNVIPIFEAGAAEGELFIAMRYVEGTDLRALLGREGRLEPVRAVEIVRQAAAALDAAHARGLVHRDVKPGNVLIARTQSGEHAYLSDFGLTKRSASDSGVTGTGQFVGTLDYAAPEQFKGVHVDARTDVYSLGCVLFECLAGRPPFRAESDAALMYAHLQEDPPRVTSERPDLPGSIDGVVARAMAKNPADRQQSAGEVAREAALALSGTSPVAAGSRGTGMRPRPRWLLPVAAVAVVAVVVAVVASMSGDGAHPPTNASPGAAGAAPPLESVAAIDPDTGEVTDTIAGLEIDALRSIHPRIAFGEGGLWVMDAIAVTHVDVETGVVEPPIPLPHAGIAGFIPVVVAGFGDVLMTDLGDTAGMGAITRIDPATDEIVETVSFPSTGGATGLGLGRAAIWESFADGTLIEIEPRTLRETARLDLGGSLDALGVGRAGVWVGDNLAGTVLKIDPRTGQAGEPIEVSGSVNGIAVSGETAWVLDRGAGTVTPVDPDSGPGQPVRVGEEPSDISSGLGAIWVTDSSGSLWRVDPTSHSASEIPVESPLEALAIDAEGQDLIWVLVSDVSQRGT